jgi:pimeloyl-ACP methyl ester carboxylesterase
MSPPPYGPNAVRELMDELHGESLVLSAHSQGSVVATVALSQLDEKQAGRIKRVITYGSPLQLIYSKLFVQSGLDTLVKTRGGIRDLPWYNLWRRSDYLGGMCLPLPDEANVNFEADGLGHSGYECTRQFRQLTKGIPPVEPGDEAARCGARSA